MKKCTKCKIEKEEEEFRFRKDQNRRATICKKCESTKVKAKFFGVTFEELLKFMERHNHTCGICGVSEEAANITNNKTTHYGLYIDHCHKTKKLRGLLCHHCNLVLGHAKDNPDILKKAIDYLKI